MNIRLCIVLLICAGVLTAGVTKVTSVEGIPEYRLDLQHTMAAAYIAHSYGRPVIANRAVVERVQIDKLQAFHRKFHQPANAVLAVAGKVDEPDSTLVTYTVEPALDVLAIVKAGDFRKAAGTS